MLPKILSLIVLIVGSIVVGVGFPVAWYFIAKEKLREAKVAGSAVMIIGGGALAFGLVRGWIWWAAQ